MPDIDKKLLRLPEQLRPKLKKLRNSAKALNKTAIHFTRLLKDGNFDPRDLSKEGDVLLKEVMQLDIELDKIVQAVEKPITKLPKDMKKRIAEPINTEIESFEKELKKAQVQRRA